MPRPFINHTSIPPTDQHTHQHTKRRLTTPWWRDMNRWGIFVGYKKPFPFFVNFAGWPSTMSFWTNHSKNWYLRSSLALDLTNNSFIVGLIWDRAVFAVLWAGLMLVVVVVFCSFCVYCFFRSFLELFPRILLHMRNFCAFFALFSFLQETQKEAEFF